MQRQERLKVLLNSDEEMVDSNVMVPRLPSIGKLSHAEYLEAIFSVIQETQRCGNLYEKSTPTPVNSVVVLLLTVTTITRTLKETKCVNY